MREITLQIEKITVLQIPGTTDKVYLHTALPSTMPAVTNQSPTLYFDVAVGKGADYVREHFAIEPEVICDR